MEGFFRRRSSRENIIEPSLRFYEILKTIKECEYSTVYLVKEKFSEACYAMKKVSGKNLNNSQIRHVLHEASIMKSLAHPNVVSLRAFFTNPPTKSLPENLEGTEATFDTDLPLQSYDFYFVMDYMEGGELFNLLSQTEKLTEGDVRSYMLQIGEAVRYLHKRNIAHCDLIPENILIKVVGNGCKDIVRIADFGSALQFDGTPHHFERFKDISCPEHFANKPCQQPVDVWYCGVLLYYMLCGFPPFFGNTEQEVKKEILQSKPLFYSPWWDNIHNSAKNLITRALDPNPETRITIEQFLKHPWMIADESTLRCLLLQTPLNMKKIGSTAVLSFHFQNSTPFQPMDIASILSLSNSLVTDTIPQTTPSQLELTCAATIPTDQTIPLSIRFSNDPLHTDTTVNRKRRMEDNQLQLELIDESHSDNTDDSSSDEIDLDAEREMEERWKKLNDKPRRASISLSPIESIPAASNTNFLARRINLVHSVQLATIDNINHNRLVENLTILTQLPIDQLASVHE